MIAQNPHFSIYLSNFFFYYASKFALHQNFGGFGVRRPNMYSAAWQLKAISLAI